MSSKEEIVRLRNKCLLGQLKSKVSVVNITPLVSTSHGGGLSFNPTGTESKASGKEGLLATLADDPFKSVKRKKRPISCIYEGSGGVIPVKRKTNEDERTVVRPIPKKRRQHPVIETPESIIRKTLTSQDVYQVFKDEPMDETWNTCSKSISSEKLLVRQNDEKEILCSSNQDINKLEDRKGTLGQRKGRPLSGKVPLGPTAVVKTKMTKMSRGDLLLNSLRTHPAHRIPKPVDHLVSLTLNLKEFSRNPVDRIIRKMENNMLSKVTNKVPLQSIPVYSQHIKSKELDKKVISQESSLLPRNSYPYTESSISCNASICSGTTTQKKLDFSTPQATLVTTTRLQEDQVYHDTLMWDPQWLDESGAKSTLSLICHKRPVLTNLPMYKNYEVYKNTFYPLMLLELWAGLLQDYNGKESTQSPRRNHQQRFFRCGNVELKVGIEGMDFKHTCPLMPDFNPRQRKDACKPEQLPFFHCFRLVGFVDRPGEINRDLDFGTLTLDFEGLNKVVLKRKFFAFFQDPILEEINSTTIIPHSLQKLARSKKFKVTFPIVTHIKSELNGLMRQNVAVIRKICYISSRIRDFRAIAQLPNSPLFSHILFPPCYGPAEVMTFRNVDRSQLHNAAYELLNPIQRCVAHHISTRVLKINGPDIMLLHGPPGTGKTRTIVGLILQLILHSSFERKLKILVCTPSNTAVDEVIRRLIHENESLKIVRIGEGSTGDDLKKFNLEEIVRPRATQTGQRECINESILGIDKKIKTATAEINSLKLGDGQMKNKNRIFSLEECISDWKNDRKMYLGDLNSIRSDRKGVEKAKLDVILRSQVVFSTLNSSNSGQLRPQLNRAMQGVKQRNASLFNCCIVDEATQSTEPESLSPLLLGCEKLVLVGDPMQLPATVLSAEAEARKFRQSLFTRLYNHYEDKMKNSPDTRSPVMMLTTQYRMHPEILQWPNKWFYGKKLRTHRSIDERMPLAVRPYLFLNISSKESNAQNGQISNDEELRLVRVILAVLLEQYKVDPRHKNLYIGIITPYNEQRRKMGQILDRIRVENVQFANSIEVDTVDSFQGREKDIVILSCVRSMDLGFIKTPERLNVALTRAKQSLIIVGNGVCLNTNVMWKNLMDDASERGHYRSVPIDFALQGNSCLYEFIERTLLLPG